jgi:hypothetical protein
MSSASFPVSRYTQISNQAAAASKKGTARANLAILLRFFVLAKTWVIQVMSSNVLALRKISMTISSTTISADARSDFISVGSCALAN